MSKAALGLLAAYWPEDTPRYAHIPLKTVGEATLYAAAEASPNRIALASASGTLTYAELASKARRFGEALRNRVDPGGRVAIATTDAAEMVIAAFGAFEADALAFLHHGQPSTQALDAFSPDLIVGAGAFSHPFTAASFEDIIAGEGRARSKRPDLRAPILAQPLPGGKGEALHNHRSLAAIGISLGKFYLLAEDIYVVMLEPPADWCALSIMLGALQRGATIWAGWESTPLAMPAKVDYAVCSWDWAARLIDNPRTAALPARIAAGLIVGVQGPFSTSRRLRIARKIRSDVLTILGRNDLGPVIGSHPAWFVNEAAGIPLPSVDLRPLNPTSGEPLSLGWEVVESAEIGVKSSLSPAGGTRVPGANAQGWLRSGMMAQIDITGFYFLLQDKRFRSA